MRNNKKSYEKYIRNHDSRQLQYRRNRTKKFQLQIKIKNATSKKIKEENAPKNSCDFPNFHKSGSIAGMKNLYYGKDALLVRCGDYIYNVTSEPEIYHNAEILQVTYCIITTSEKPHIDVLKEYYPKVKNGVFAEITNNSGIKKKFLFKNSQWNFIETRSIH